jgi:hypothetical protein
MNMNDEEDNLSCVYWEENDILRSGIFFSLWNWTVVCSGIMALFYLYKVATGGNHIVKKETWSTCEAPVAPLIVLLRANIMLVGVERSVFTWILCHVLKS